MRSLKRSANPGCTCSGTSRKIGGCRTTVFLYHNVSPDELQEGRRFYEDVRVDFVDGRIAINKANLI